MASSRGRLELHLVLYYCIGVSFEMGEMEIRTVRPKVSRIWICYAFDQRAQLTIYR